MLRTISQFSENWLNLNLEAYLVFVRHCLCSKLWLGRTLLRPRSKSGQCWKVIKLWFTLLRPRSTNGLCLKNLNLPSSPGDRPSASWNLSQSIACILLYTQRPHPNGAEKRRVWSLSLIISVVQGLQLSWRIFSRRATQAPTKDCCIRRKSSSIS